MPIPNTSGIERGELRLFEVQRLKIKPHYKISCNFYREGCFWGENTQKKYNDNK